MEIAIVSHLQILMSSTIISAELVARKRNGDYTSLHSLLCKVLVMNSLRMTVMDNACANTTGIPFVVRSSAAVKTLVALVSYTIVTVCHGWSPTE